MPDHASDPPHWRATLKCSTDWSVRSMELTSGSISSIHFIPALIVFLRPPMSCKVIVLKNGFSFKLKASIKNLIWFASHPNPISNIPAKFGCWIYPNRTLWRASKPSPESAIPHPVPWVNETTPSTFGNLDNFSSLNASAIFFAAVAEQFTEVSIPI